MGELNAWEANAKRDNYAWTLQQMKSEIRENFEEMDFTNARERNLLERHVIEIEDMIQRQMNKVAGIGFE